MASTQLEIRSATEDDVSTLYQMICGLENKVMDRTAFDFIFYRNLENEFVGYFLAEIDGKPVGMGSCHVQMLLHHAAFVAEVQEMYVEEGFRSQNIGQAIMEQLVQFAKSKGAIQLEVTSRNYRENAHRFYQRENFEKSHVKLVRYF